MPHRETLVADAGRNPDTMRGIAAALSLAEMSLGKGIYCTLYYTIPDISLYLEGRDVARYGSYLMTDPLAYVRYTNNARSLQTTASELTGE